MVLFGGFDGFNRLSDVWTLPLGGALIYGFPDVLGTPPTARQNHAAIHDRVHDRIVVFGGNDGSTNLSDVWGLSLASGLSWTNLTPDGTPPAGLDLLSAIYDPARARMVMFGWIRWTWSTKQSLGADLACSARCWTCGYKRYSAACAGVSQSGSRWHFDRVLPGSCGGGLIAYL